jgi:hypothetical protein
MILRAKSAVSRQEAIVTANALTPRCYSLRGIGTVALAELDLAS